jgi:hypothetical protein
MSLIDEALSANATIANGYDPESADGPKSWSPRGWVWVVRGWGCMVAS